jgi:hypothetical protein
VRFGEEDECFSFELFDKVDSAVGDVFDEVAE